MIVVPAIIPRNKEQMLEELKKISGFAKLVQVDISDGIFTPFKTWPFNGQDTDFFAKLKTEEEGLPYWDNIDYEFHLMINDPEEYVEGFIHAGAKTIIVQIETINDFSKIFDLCKQNEVSLGIAIKPKTDTSKLVMAKEADFFQVMGSDLLGKHGEKLDSRAVDKIKEINNIYPDKTIAIDIGVNMETRDVLVEAGATKLISGSDILDSENPEEEYNNLIGE
jgi:ribulose-phosphate 3-epimerase